MSVGGVASWSLLRMPPPARRPVVAVPVALLLVALIGAADYLTGYEVRLAILYLLPVAVATWACGRPWGLAIAVLGPLTWAASFASQHAYSSDIYFYWDCVVMVTTFVLFVELLVRLSSALERSDARFVRVLDELYSAVFVTDEADRVLFANRRSVELFGAGIGSPAARQIAARFSPARADSAAGAAHRGEVLAGGTEVRDLENGRWYLVQAGHMPWVDRRRVGLTVLTDITDQKLAEALQREHREALHQTSRLVGLAEAATTLAHELNQPLVAIVGYNAACLRLLDAGATDRTELRATMERCRAQAVRAGDIIHRMRDLTRRRTPELVACDLNAMVRQTLEWTDEVLARAGIGVDLDLADSLPTVQADRILIEQVILNLVQNAADAMRDVEPARRTLRIATAPDGRGSVRVAVTDRGRGIPHDVAERLFTPFFTTKADGLGLGLSICRSAVEIHGGSIGFTADVDGGTTFYFLLPRRAS